jgi:hypothetical protein
LGNPCYVLVVFYLLSLECLPFLLQAQAGDARKITEITNAIEAIDSSILAYRNLTGPNVN